jgi:hypothetical protein
MFLQWEGHGVNGTGPELRLCFVLSTINPFTLGQFVSHFTDSVSSLVRGGVWSTARMSTYVTIESPAVIFKLAYKNIYGSFHMKGFQK